MKRSIFLCFSLALLVLAGCQSKPVDAGDAFSRQSSYECTLTYSITYDAIIDGEGYAGMTQSFSVHGAASLEDESCGFSGTLETTANGDSLGSLAVESYGDPSGSYYRYGTVCYSDSGRNSFRAVSDFPSHTDLSVYERADHTEALYGTICNVWYATEIADDSAQRFVSGMTQGEFSMEGCLSNVTLWTDEDTDLPVALEIDYSNIGDLDVTFFDDDGNRFTITDLTFYVTYTGYGTPLDIEIPADLLAAPNAEDVLSGHTADTEVPEELLDHGVVSYTGDPNADLSEAYAILNDDSSACYIIDTPEFMLLDVYERDYLSFYYAYAEDDVEFIDYSFFSRFTDEDERKYALDLPDFLADTPGFSDVTDTGLQTITIHGRDIAYNVLYYTYEEDGVTYDCTEIYSWVEAPNERGCLEVDIVEYNATEDGVFIDIEEELIYAYEAVLGYGVLNE